MCDSPSSSMLGSSASTASLSSVSSDPSEAERTTFGTGPYHNIRRGIELRSIGDDFQGLFATEPLAKGTVLWHNRPDGPAEERYRKIYGEEIQHLSPEQLRYFIRYSYQNDNAFFISPLCAQEVELDFSNFWNHSCDPNTLPSGEDDWVAIRDIAADEQLTIDYCTFDSNEFICIEHCLCASPHCRRFVRADDYRIRELQVKYAGHFLPYIQKRIDEEAEAAANGIFIGGAGGPNNDFSAASVRAFHQSQCVDVEAHNRAGLAALMARYAHANATDSMPSLSCKRNAATHQMGAELNATHAPETITV